MCEFTLEEPLKKSSLVVLHSTRNEIQSFLVIIRDEKEAANNKALQWSHGVKGKKLKVSIPLIEEELDEKERLLRPKSRPGSVLAEKGDFPTHKPWMEPMMKIRNKPRLLKMTPEVEDEIECSKGWGAKNWEKITEMGLLVSEVNDKAIGIIAHKKVKIELSLCKEEEEKAITVEETL